MTSTLRVLVIDDSERDAALVVHALVAGGYDVRYERVCTAEALAISLHQESWDLAVADYNKAIELDPAYAPAWLGRGMVYRQQGNAMQALGDFNKAMELKPDMYATVTFTLPLAARLVVPISAVVYTGPRRLVFVDLGNGALRPQEVTVGARSGDLVEVTHAWDPSGRTGITASWVIREALLAWWAQ